MKNLNQYTEQAQLFLNETNTSIEISFKKHGNHFEDEKITRDIYQVKIIRGNRGFTFDFGNSINNSAFKIINSTGKELKAFDIPNRDKYFKNDKWDMQGLRRYVDYTFYRLSNKETIQTPEYPSVYDILACLTTYGPTTLKDFCNEYGYDEDSKKAEKIYNAVVTEYKNVCTIWNDSEIEKLSDIK